MTDILAKLAALTKKDENGLLPCRYAAIAALFTASFLAKMVGTMPCTCSTLHGSSRGADPGPGRQAR